jgi:hypothetical protein
MGWFALAPALIFFAVGGLTGTLATREAGFSALRQATAACAAVALDAADLALILTMERDLPAGPTRAEVQAMRPDAGQPRPGKPLVAA